MSDTTWALRFRVEIGPDERRAVASHFGDTGMASLSDCRQYIRDMGMLGLEEITHEYLTRQRWEAGNDPRD